MTIAGSLARWAMERVPAEAPVSTDPRFAQIFDHNDYLTGSDEHRRAIRLGSSQYRYDYEVQEQTFGSFFPDYDLRDEFTGRTLLDLGCLTGGRTAAWTDLYGVGQAFGFDIDEEYVQAAREFADLKSHLSTFRVGFAEDMPYDDNMFDVIATFDVLEHVQDVAAAMSESLRVLKPGGKLFAVFPPYYNPIESHLELATRLHGLNLVFPGRALGEGHHEVIRRRGPHHSWYNTDSDELPPYYKSPFLNGITVRRFRSIIERQGWVLEAWPKRPILTVGRRAKAPHFKALSKLITPLASVPMLEEIFLHSVSVVLCKPQA